MRVLTYVGPNELEWREAPDPVVKSLFDAVVRPVASAPCDLVPVVTPREHVDAGLLQLEL